MSEPRPEREPSPGDARASAQRPGQGKKILGMSRPQAAGLGIIIVVVGGYLIYRARKNAAASAASGTSTGTCPDGSTPDASGNCPQNSADLSGQLDTLQSEIAALQGAMASGSGGGSAGTVAGSTGTSTTGATAATTTTPAAGSTTAAKPAAAAAGPVSSLQVTNTGSTSFTVRWNAAQGATGGYEYIVRDLASHQQVGSPHQTRGTSATVTGLKSGTDYNFGIQGLPGGPGANLHVRTK